eukprot:276491-Pleurochrysis_carterae.AAC.1
MRTAATRSVAVQASVGRRDEADGERASGGEGRGWDEGGGIRTGRDQLRDQNVESIFSRGARRRRGLVLDLESALL